MHKLFALALLAGVCTAMPGSAATIFLPEDHSFAVTSQTAVQLPLAPSSDTTSALAKAFGTDQALFSGQAITAFRAGIKAEGQFVAVQNAVPLFTFSGTGDGKPVRDPSHALVGYVSSFVTPVPEPALWVMLLIGMGAIGVALRRDRLKQSALPY